ncbi:hypothetical protein [Methanoregula sp.]|uniref:hypothetical protein n=1 Tax=Methanoregula sp. TaxID=2052170 RepID=UPI003C768CC4
MCTGLDDKELWGYFLRQDEATWSEFGIGIVGIGALLLAFGSIDNYALKVIISLIGLSGSFVLSMHIYGARKEIDSIIEVLKLKPNNNIFFKDFDEIKKWRKTDSWYIRSFILMQYFMIFVLFAWAMILIFLIIAPRLIL